MDHSLGVLVDLTGVLQEYRTIYIAGTFAILGFVIQKKGYGSQIERFIISVGFLFFALGNLFQSWQTSKNIETIAQAGVDYMYVTPLQVMLTHLPFDIAIFLVLLFVFKVRSELVKNTK